MTVHLIGSGGLLGPGGYQPRHLASATPGAGKGGQRDGLDAQTMAGVIECPVEEKAVRLMTPQIPVTCVVVPGAVLGDGDVVDVED